MALKAERRILAIDRHFNIVGWSEEDREDRGSKIEDRGSGVENRLTPYGAILYLRSSILDCSCDCYCVVPAGATAMSTIGVFTLSVLTSVALPDGRYIE